MQIFSVGGSYNFQSFNGIDYLRMLLIDSPTAYLNVTDTQNRTLASSIVVANIQTDPTQFTSNLNISLYFRVKNDYVSQPIEKY